MWSCDFLMSQSDGWLQRMKYHIKSIACRCDKHTDKYSGEYQTDHKKEAEAVNRYLHSTLSAGIKNTFSIKGVFLDLDYNSTT